MNVFELSALLTLDKSKYDKGLDEAESKGGKFGSGLKAGAAVAGAAIAATGAAAVKVGSDFVKATGQVAEYGDHIDKMSQKIGMSAEAYQEWDAVMQHCGTSVDALKPAIKTLANQAQKGAEEFEKLGISQEEVKNLSQEDLFAKVISGLQDMEAGTERTAIASKLLGRGATELGALLNTSAEDTDKMRQRVHELGGVMSDEAVKAAATYQDTLQDMMTAVDGIKRNLLSDFLPSLTQVMDGLTEIFAGNTEEGLEKVAEGIENTVDKISEILPKAVEIGSQIILSLGQAIIDNLPVLATSAVDIVTKLTGSILDNLPMIIKVGLDVIIAITTGIAKNLPELIPAIVDAVVTIADTLIQPKNLAMIIKTGIELIGALVSGLLKAVPTLIKGVGTIFVNFGTALGEEAAKLYLKATNWLTEKFETVKTWGKDLIDKFIEGVKAKFSDIKEAFKDLGQLIKDLIGFSEPKEGPLSNFHTFAPDMIDLFIDGIKGKQGELYDTVASAFDFSDAITSPRTNRGNIRHGKYSGGGETGGAASKKLEDMENIWDLTFGDDLYGITKQLLASVNFWQESWSSFFYEFGLGRMREDVLEPMQAELHEADKFITLIDQDCGHIINTVDQAWKQTEIDNAWMRTAMTDMKAELIALRSMFENGKAKVGANILNTRELAMTNV